VGAPFNVLPQGATDVVAPLCLTSGQRYPPASSSTWVKANVCVVDL